jgi:hypothetical protein
MSSSLIAGSTGFWGWYENPADKADEVSPEIARVRFFCDGDDSAGVAGAAGKDSCATTGRAAAHKIKNNERGVIVVMAGIRHHLPAVV